MLWAALKQRRLSGVKFRRKHAIGPHLVDFYACSLRLAVEIAGAAATERRRFLEQQGVVVVMFGERDIEWSLPWALEQIASIVAELRRDARLGEDPWPDRPALDEPDA